MSHPNNQGGGQNPYSQGSQNNTPYPDDDNENLPPTNTTYDLGSNHNNYAQQEPIHNEHESEYQHDTSYNSNAATYQSTHQSDNIHQTVAGYHHDSDIGIQVPDAAHSATTSSPFNNNSYLDPSYSTNNESNSLHPVVSDPFATASRYSGSALDDDDYNNGYDDDRIPLNNLSSDRNTGGYYHETGISTASTPYPVDDYDPPQHPYYGADQGPTNTHVGYQAPYGNQPTAQMPDENGPLSIAALIDVTDDDWRQRQQLPENHATRQVNLVNGVYSVEHAVPPQIKDQVESKYLDLEEGNTEFTHMRYTAATADPDDFEKEGYTLRPQMYNRDTELLIAVTYYSEDKVLTARTLYGIMKNIRRFCRQTRSEFWSSGPEPWKRIVVSIIMDGIKPCRKETLDLLATMGIYQDGVMKKSVNDKPTVAHIFEFTSQISVDPELHVKSPETDKNKIFPPIQYILCLKQENSKKINSHRWLFNGFGPILKPNICVLLDAGTKPGNDSILHLWRGFGNRNVGGACGEIHAMLGKGANLALKNPLVAAQNFEYKISNILDKPLESTFGFISVLPGAFSAYRYKALTGRPLEQYFLGDHSLADRLGDRGLNGMNIFQRNMFLAEDRILCFEITFKQNEKWHLQYIKASTAETDVPEQIDEFISQRRRWINGSFAATLYSMMHFAQIYRTSHNLFRMVMMHIQLFYNFVNMFLTWLSLAAFYLTTTIVMQLAARPNNSDIEKGSDSYVNPFPFTNETVSTSIALVLRFIYVLFLMISFILALGNRPKGSRIMYKLLFIVFGVLQTYALVISINLAYRAFASGSPFSDGVSSGATGFVKSSGFLVVTALASTFGLYILSGIIYLDVMHLLHSMVQYLFIMPSFTNVINVYAFCNWHDVTWGTKGADKPDALPDAKSKISKDGTTEVVEALEKTDEELKAQYEEVKRRAIEPYPVEQTERKRPETEDLNRTFRTNLIISWIVCNCILAVGLTSESAEDIGFSQVTDRTKYYFFALIIITAIMAIIRFAGCVIFVIKNYISYIFDRR